MLSPDETWALWTILLAAAAVGLWAERTRWGRRISGVVVTMGATFALSNLGVIPTSAPTYDLVWSRVVPLAIPLLLFQADIRRIVREAGPTLAAFGLGAVGTVIGTFVAFWLVDLGPQGAKLAGIFCSTYVGGSMNYAASAEVLGLRSGDLLTAGVAADNLVMTLYFLVLFTLPSIRWLRARYPIRHRDDSPESPGSEPKGETLSLSHLALALTIAAGACAVGYALEGVIGWQKTGILWVTVLVVLAATISRGRMARIRGADKLGALLMQVFFATIGASAHVGVVLRVGPGLFVFAALILAMHLLMLLGAGWLFRLDLAELTVASNANMGGPSTAAAMAVGRRWNGLVIPAILCGTLGYATATFVGVAVGRLLGA